MAADRAGELDEWLQPGSRRPGQPRVEVDRRERWVVEVVEQPELLLEQERAVQRLVGLLDLAELRELVDGLLGGALEQRPAGALDPFALGGVGALVGVLLVATDLVDRPLGETHDVERIECDLGVWQVVADRLLVAAGHVDRAPPDRVLAIAEQIEERLQGGGVATRGAPHDRPRGGGRRPKSDTAARVGRRSRRSRSRPARAAAARRGDRRQPVARSSRPCPTRFGVDRRSGSWPSAAPATPRCPRSHACGARRAWPTAPPPDARRSRDSEAGELALDHAPVSTEIQMPPALQPAVMDLEPAGLAAAPAHSSPAPKPDGHDHPLGAKADIDDRRAGEAQKPVECGADAHLALRVGRLTFDGQQPAPQGGCASPRSAQPPTKTSAAKGLLTRPTRPVLHPQTARRPPYRNADPDEGFRPREGVQLVARNEPRSRGCVGDEPEAVDARDL